MSGDGVDGGKPDAGDGGESRKRHYRLRALIIQLKTAINPENVIIDVLFSKSDNSAIIA